MSSELIYSLCPLKEALNFWKTKFRFLISLFIVIFCELSFPCSSVNAQVATYNYDIGTNGIGRLTSVIDQTGSTTYSYDQRGNPIVMGKTTDAVNYTMQYSYDSLNRVVNITYPDNETVQNIYNNQGLLNQVQSVTNGTFYISNIDYNAAGQETSKTLGNGSIVTYTYHPQNFRLTGLSTPGFQSLSYLYDNVGNIKSITDNIGVSTQTFGYDSLNRLTSAVSASSPAFSDTYFYDSIGNMTCNTSISSCSSTTPNYFYPQSGQAIPHGVVRIATTSTYSYTYDPNGNITAGPNTSISYDFENRPASVATPAGSSTTTFAYDGEGNRVKKTSNGVSTAITYYIGKYYECVVVTSSQCSKYIFDNNQRIAQKLNGSNSLYYFYSDQLGSNNLAVQYATTSTIVQTLAYYPYGKTRINLNSVNIRYMFTDKELESGDTVGLYYFGARYYDPGIGRFMGADTIDPDRTNPQTLNRFSYASNNPVKFVDPNGHFFWIPALIAGAGAFVWDAIHTPGAANAPASDQDIVQGPTSLEHGISLGTGALIGATGGFAGVEGGLGQGVKTTAGEIIQAESPVPLSPSNFAKDTRNLSSDIKTGMEKGNRIFERVMTGAELKATQETGFLRGGREGINFFTNSASLNAKRAQQRLGLEGPLRDIRLRFQLKGDVEISGPRIAPGGRTGTPGGGLEFSTERPTPIEIIRIDPLVK